MASAGLNIPEFTQMIGLGRRYVNVHVTRQVDLNWST